MILMLGPVLLVGAACGGEDGEITAPPVSPAEPIETDGLLTDELLTDGASSDLESQLDAIRADVEQTASGLASVGSLEELEAELDEASNRFGERADELAAQAGQVPEDTEDERAELEARLRQLSDELGSIAGDVGDSTVEDLPELIGRVTSAATDAFADIGALAERVTG